jgi:hypothetical protein
MSELSAEPASLVERLHSFFHVELPNDPELAGQYNLDPSGTLAEHFTDLTPADLDDAVRLVSDNTTVSYTDFGGDAPPPVDGESLYAYAFRANYEPGAAAPDSGPGLHGMDSLDGLDGLDSGLVSSGPFHGAAVHPGADLPSYTDADPTFGDPATPVHPAASGDLPDHAAHTGETVDPSDLPHDVSGLHELAQPEPETGHLDDGSWAADLHEHPALDAGDGHFDPGLGG